MRWAPRSGNPHEPSGFCVYEAFNRARRPEGLARWVLSLLPAVPARRPRVARVFLPALFVFGAFAAARTAAVAVSQVGALGGRADR